MPEAENRYHHQDTDARFLSLHDCSAEKVSYEQETLSVYFPDGFWLLENHPENPTGEVVKTDAAKVAFSVLDEGTDGVTVYTFGKTKRGRSVRKEWPLADFMKTVNNGTYRVEFVGQYEGYQSRLYTCYVYFDKRPWCRECQIWIHTDKVTFCWNQIREEPA